MRFALFEDRLAPNAPLEISGTARGAAALYVAAGGVRVVDERGMRTIAPGDAVRLTGDAKVESLEPTAVVYRWALAPQVQVRGGSGTQCLRDADLPLTDGQERILRCDRVDFPLGGVAYLHTHRGPGIRVLLQGQMMVRSDGHELNVRPGEAWFENGSSPVYAAASSEHLTAFARVMILPPDMKGKSSIRYVDPADANKPKTQAYRVFVDEIFTV